MKAMTRSLIVGTAALFAAACADRTVADRDVEGRQEDVVIHDNQENRDMNRTATTKADADDYTNLSSYVVRFESGSARLTDASRTGLRDLIRSAQASGDIEDIKVTVWSDKAAPAPGTKADLPKADRDLASRRAEVIEDYLEDTLDAPSVETFSMAERANWLSRMFRTDDAELKSEFAKRDTGVSQAELNMLRNGKASHAVVVVETEPRARD